MLDPPLLSAFDPVVESEGSVDPLSLATWPPTTSRRRASLRMVVVEALVRHKDELDDAEACPAA